MSDVYKIAVALTMTSNAPAFMAALSSKILHAHTQVKDLEGGLNRLNRIKLAIGGGLAIAGGAAGLSVLGKMVDKGNELVKVQQNMAAAGVKATEIQEAYAKAWSLTEKYKNVGAAEALKVISEARMTFGSQADATHHSEDFIKMISFLKAFQGGKHGGGAANFEAEAIAAMKSGEIAGKVSPEEMAEHVKQLTAMRVAYGDQLKITQYLTAQRAAGVSLRNSSDEFRYGMFPALVQENGPGAGTMLMTAFNKIVAGTGNRTKSLEHMAEIGLLKKDMLEYNKMGMVKGLKDPSAIMNNKDAALNFGAWVNDTLRPLLNRKLDTEGVTGQDRAVRESQLISAMFPDRNAAKAITEVLQQFSKLTKDAHLMAEARKAMNEAGYLDQSWDGQKQAFHEQWENFVQALGAPMVGQATAALKGINSALSEMSQWASRPEMAGTVAAIGKGLAVTAAALTGAGAAALLAAIGPAGWLVGGVTGMIGAWVSVDPSGFKATMVAMKDAAVYVYDAVKGFATDPAVLNRLGMFFAVAKSEALIVYNAVKGFVADPTVMGPLKAFILTTKAEAEGIYRALKDMIADPKSGETIRGTLTTTFGEVKWILDWYKQAKDFISGLGAGTGLKDGKSLDLKTLGLDWNGDLLGQLATKLRAGLVDLDKAFSEAATHAGKWAGDVAAEIKSWPGRLAEAIAEMGAGLVTAIGDMLKSIFNKLNPFSKTAAEGGGGMGGMIQRASFTTGGGANDNFGGSVGRALGRGAGGSNGFSGSSGALSGGGTIGTAAGAGSNAGNLTRLIDEVSRKHGLDPRIMEGIRAGESGHRADYDKKHDALESSWGPFQLNRRRGLGVLFEKETGLDVRNPATIASQADWVARYIAKQGPRALKNWMGYHGPRNADPRWGDSGYKPSAPAAPPPTAGPPPRQDKPQMQSVELHVDGRKMAGVVVKHVASASKYPKHIGGMDTHGGWRPPGTTLTDAA